MTCVWMSGFETGNVVAGETEWSGGSLANFTTNTTTVFSGLRSGLFSGIGYLTSTAGFGVTTGTLRAYVRLSSATVGVASRIMGIQSTAGHLASIRILTDRTLQLILNGPPGAMVDVAAYTQPLAANTWYCLELQVAVDTKQLSARIDGIAWAQVPVTGFANGTHIDSIYVGPDEATPAGCNIYYDDVIFFKRSGQHNTTWPGASAGMFMVVPIADHFQFGWAAQGGGTFFSEIDELPAAAVDTTTYIKETAGVNESVVGVYFTDTPSVVGVVNAVLVGVRGGGTAATDRKSIVRWVDVNNIESREDIEVNWNLNGWKTVYPVLTLEEAFDGAPRMLTTDYLFSSQSYLPYPPGIGSHEATYPAGTRYADFRIIRTDSNVAEIRISAVWAMVSVAVSYGTNARLERPAPRVLVELDLI